MSYRFLNIILLLAFFLLVTSFIEVRADTSEDLINKLNTIESRLKVLEKATFNQTTSSLGNNVSLDDYQSIITKQSIQIIEIQNEIQVLTSQLEEVLFTLQSTINNFNNFREDTEFRFIDVDNKTASIETSIEKNQAMISEPKLDLEPKVLGTLEVPVENSMIDSPFEVKIEDQDQQQEKVNTIAQDDPILIEEQIINLSILPEGDELGQYEYAMNLLKQGDYETAEKAFIEFLMVGTDEGLLSNSSFYLAETYYVRENYKKAAKSYLNLYQNYPEAKKAPKALLKLGISLVNMDQKEQGCVTFLKLQEDFPSAEQSLLDRGSLEVQRNGCKVS
jgi:tol-pal system protein YbgF